MMRAKSITNYVRGLLYVTTQNSSYALMKLMSSLLELFLYRC